MARRVPGLTKLEFSIQPFRNRKATITQHDPKKPYVRREKLLSNALCHDSSCPVRFQSEYQSITEMCQKSRASFRGYRCSVNHRKIELPPQLSQPAAQPARVK